VPKAATFAGFNQKPSKPELFYIPSHPTTAKPPKAPIEDEAATMNIELSTPNSATRCRRHSFL
jgi:hypothetical protein